MTPMNNADYLTRLEHADELEALKAAKKASGLTYEQLAELIGVNKVWLASVFEGQQYVPEEYLRQTGRPVGVMRLKSVHPLLHFSTAIRIKEILIRFFTGFMKSLILTVPLSKISFMNRAETPS